MHADAVRNNLLKLAFSTVVCIINVVNTIVQGRVAHLHPTCTTTTQLQKLRPTNKTKKRRLKICEPIEWIDSEQKTIIATT
jgi:hypothetical protein